MKAARDVELCETHEAALDAFERVAADGVIDTGEIVLIRLHLRQQGAALSTYSRERQILRILERRGLSSPWARRQLRELEQDERYLDEATAALSAA